MSRDQALLCLYNKLYNRLGRPPTKSEIFQNIKTAQGIFARINWKPTNGS